MSRARLPRHREKPRHRMNLEVGLIGARAVRWCVRSQQLGSFATDCANVGSREGTRSSLHDRCYFTALAPAVAATPSCWPVPPLAPIAPMILPLEIISTPPSDAIGCSGNVVNAVLPAAY